MKVIFVNRGYFLIEALLSVVIFSVLILSLFSMLSFLQNRTVRSTFESDATALLQDGMEITHSALLSNWTLYPDGTYYAAFNPDENAWELTPGEGAVLETRYSRKIELKKVCRDANGKKVGSGGVCTVPNVQDAYTREVTTTVSWLEEGVPKQIEATLLVLRANK